MSPSKVIWSVCRGLALTAQVTHSFFISSLLGGGGWDAGWLAPPPSLSVQILKEIGENKNKASRRDVQRKREREIRDKAENRKPFCASTGHRHSNPSLPSQDSNDLRVHPPWIVLSIFYRAGLEGHAPPFQTPPLLSEVKDYKDKDGTPSCKCFCEVIMTTSPKYSKRKFLLH